MRWPARTAALTLEGLTALCGAIFAPTGTGVRMIALAANLLNLRRCLLCAVCECARRRRAASAGLPEFASPR